MGDEAGDRRRFLIRAGAAGAAAWVAPLVVSSPAFAAASVPPPTEPNPPCLSCNSANVLNPGFDDGLNAWTSTGSVSVFEYRSSVFTTPPGGEPTFAVLFDFSSFEPPVQAPPGRIEQNLTIDPMCVGRPFTLSFFSSQVGPLFGDLDVLYGVQFTDTTGDVGSPFTISPPISPLTPGPAYLARMQRKEVTGTVPDGASGVTIFFFGNASAIDLVDFTVCAE